MKAKLLLLAALLSMGMGTDARAQEFYLIDVVTHNAVGYVNVSLPAGVALIANPLNNGSNSLNEIIPPGSGPNPGDTVYRFDNVADAYGESSTYNGEWSPNLIFNPGEGFLIRREQAGTITFVGEVPEGYLTNPVPARFSIRASQVPQSGTLGLLAFPAVDGDVVYVFDRTTQSYKEPYQYYEGYGWYSVNPDDPGPDGPTIGVAESFFVRKTPPGANWVRYFSIFNSLSSFRVLFVNSDPL